MRALLLLAASLALALPAHAQDEPRTARVLEVTLADLDEDSMDFLIGWERWKGDVLDLASKGGSRYALVPIAPGMALNRLFIPALFDGSGAPAVRPSRAARATRGTRTGSRQPVRIARAPRGRTGDRSRPGGRPRPPRGLAPLGTPRSFRPPPRATRGAGGTHSRGPRTLAAPPPRSGGRGAARGGSGGKARPRGSGPRPRGAAGPTNVGDRIPRRHR
jgi:hypothetical protein